MESAEQWRWLKENYAHMTEDELCAMAEEAYDLTEIAREALQGEIKERRLAIKLNTTPSLVSGADLSPDLDLIVMFRLWDESQARQSKQIFEKAGILCYFGPDNLLNPDDFQGSFADGIDLKVAFPDRERAQSAWKQRLSDEPEDDQEYAVLCPKCRSGEILFQGRDPKETVRDSREPKFDWSWVYCSGSSQWEDERILQEVSSGWHAQQKEAKFDWNCISCGHSWKDEGLAQEVPAGWLAQKKEEESEEEEEDAPSGN